jgi:hypothetical protein
LNATQSGSSASSNAVIAHGGCTGTLVSPTTVLTAGHCLTNSWIPSDGHSFKDGEWHIFRRGYSRSIVFGPDPSADDVVTIRAYRMSMPRAINMETGTGHDDIVLLGLDKPVPPDVAIPRAILFEDPGVTSSSRLTSYGHGGVEIRTYAEARNWRDADSDSSLTANMYRATLQNGAEGTGGDSGGPLLWGATNGPVIGVHQGHAEGDSDPSIRGVKTFGHGEPGVKPDISAWLAQQAGGFAYKGWAMSHASGTGNIVSSVNRHNSQGGSITVTHLETGWYQVDFEGLAATDDGHVQVTALGADSRRCKVFSFNRTLRDVRIFVICHDVAGNYANSRFVVSYMGASHLYDNGVRFLADAPTSVEQVPRNLYSSKSTPTNITRSSIGLYRFSLREMGTQGTVQVTAFGGADASYCKVGSLTTGAGADETDVTVACFDGAGNRADRRFFFQYEKGTADPLSYGTTGFARAILTVEDNAYLPLTQYHRYVTDSRVYAARRGTGLYEMFFQNVTTPGGGVHVTAFGSGNFYCKPASFSNDTSWRTYGDGVRVDVSCFDPAGTPVSSKYDAVFMSPAE